MGGYVSLAFAKLYPQKLSGLVLFHSQAASDSAESKKNRDRTIKIVQQNHTAFIHSFIPSLFAEDHVADFSNEIDALRKTAEKTSVKGIVAALLGMRDRESHLDTIEKLQAPVYYIIGKQDSRIPMETIIPQLELPSNCEALIMDEVGHMGFIEAKEKTFLSLEHFLERNLFSAVYHLEIINAVEADFRIGRCCFWDRPPLTDYQLPVINRYLFILQNIFKSECPQDRNGFSPCFIRFIKIS